jgi:hypothetical protein
MHGLEEGWQTTTEIWHKHQPIKTFLCFLSFLSFLAFFDFFFFFLSELELLELLLLLLEASSAAATGSSRTCIKRALLPAKDEAVSLVRF